jgi:pentapeptide MXKDX repeat protein
MRAYKITAFALMFATGVAGSAMAQGAMSAPQNSMAAPAGSAMTSGMAGPKDAMAMDKPMAQKKKPMKKDSMKHDSMKSDSMMAPAH